MKGFIEITEQRKRRKELFFHKSLIPLSEIKSVVENNDKTAVIWVDLGFFSEYQYFYCVESYSEVLDKIEKALN